MRTRQSQRKTKTRLSGLAIAAVLQLGVRAGYAQAGPILFSGSETNITLNPGTYIITAYGAPGGHSINSSLHGGLGAEMSGEFNFSASTTLTLLVGGGGGTAVNGGTGGGGGSFVVEGSTPLVIAGAGGGAGGFQDVGNDNDNGNVRANGGDGGGDFDSYPLSTGGTHGGGGAVGFDRQGPFGSGQQAPGGGGGGFLGNGGGSFSLGVYRGGGFSYAGGGGGGSYNPDGIDIGSGGYGGGGAGGGRYGEGGGGGGGGGYSGGGGGTIYISVGECGNGGGGGSIIDSSAIMDLAEVSGIASPDDPRNGEIIITAVPEPASVGLLAIGSLALLRRSRRRGSRAD